MDDTCFTFFNHSSPVIEIPLVFIINQETVLQLGGSTAPTILNGRDIQEMDRDEVIAELSRAADRWGTFMKGGMLP